MSKCYKHNYRMEKKAEGGYWFKCIYCGHSVFGAVTGK